MENKAITEEKTEGNVERTRFTVQIIENIGMNSHKVLKVTVVD